MTIQDEHEDNENPSDESTVSPQGYDFFADVEGTRSLAHTIEVNARFQTSLNALSRLEQNVTALAGRLQALHEHRVTYPTAWGEEVGLLTQQLRATAPESRALAERFEQRFVPRAAALWDLVNANDILIAADGYAANAGVIATALKEAETLKQQLERAEQDIQESFSRVNNSLRSLFQRVNYLEQVAERMKGISWALADNETVRAADPATYHHSAREKPGGILFLTDKRLLFEQNEEVERGMLFLKQRQKVRTVRYEIPLTLLQSLTMDGDTLLVTTGDSKGTQRFTVQGAGQAWQPYLTTN